MREGRELQWGRDLTVADSAASLRHASLSGTCFNGAATSRSRIGSEVASNTSRWCCFNGAATSRSRIVGGASRGTLVLQRFNGAATSRSRIGVGRQNRRVSSGSLQWGRDLTVADRSMRNAAREGRLLLQWGRDLTVADSTIRSIKSRLTTPLQWGRDLTVADRSLSGTLNVHAIRFNGAATSRSRIERREWDDSQGRGALQWGRDLTVADSRDLLRVRLLR